MMDLNYCVTEGDHDTLFDHLVAYSNDVAANGNVWNIEQGLSVEFLFHRRSWWLHLSHDTAP